MVVRERGSTQSQSPFLGWVPEHEVRDSDILLCVPAWLKGAPWELVSDLWVLAWPEGMYLPF